ncbi:MAG: Calcineurin-like phosphoesterase [Euryarchaeota archaeon ADurb.Bin190]|nr:MAG: Calcineurin-like phosphoesterase [Euryarchaeota archaeon ADurb.Bin190]
MTHYIVNPPIRDDLDYYRNDDDIIENILSGQSTIVLGLRRSGKTSFLYRVQRKALKDGKPTLFFDSRDFLISSDPAEEARQAILKIRASPKSLILVDEVDILFQQENSAIWQQLLANFRNHVAVMTCASVFLYELAQYPSAIREFFENCYRHPIGPLSKDEAFDLLSQSKRRDTSPIPAQLIEEIWSSGDRLPIILQALGEKNVNRVELAVSLAGVGVSILSGLAPKVKGALIAAAHRNQLDPDLPEVKFLITLGAILEKNEKAVIAGKVLGDVIRESADSTQVSAISPNWKRCARILHLSDLHFGPHCIEKPENAISRQFFRLKFVLEKDSIFPDFVVITGDLSWSGHPNEYTIAEIFLEELASWLAKIRKLSKRAARRRILILPGNHDAAWSLTNGLKPEDTGEWVHYALSPFANFVNKFHRGEIIWDLEHPCQKRCFKQPSIAFILISTSHFVTKENPKGEFGNNVQDLVVELLEKTDVKRALFRICLFHHNLRSFHNEGITIKDGESALLRFALCKPAPDLILHGHVHQGETDVFQPRKGLNKIPYSAVGSFGVRSKERPGDETRGRVDNEFAIVDLETDGTGRRFVTQFYRLRYSPAGDWQWEAGSKSRPFIL